MRSLADGLGVSGAEAAVRGGGGGKVGKDTTHSSMVCSAASLCDASSCGCLSRASLKSMIESAAVDGEGRDRRGGDDRAARTGGCQKRGMPLGSSHLLASRSRGVLQQALLCRRVVGAIQRGWKALAKQPPRALGIIGALRRGRPRNTCEGLGPEFS